MLQGKKVLLGISGSIAAYKSIFLVRLLVKNGAEVRVVMTPAAKDFVAPLTLSTLSKNKVLIELTDENTWANHVMLGRWADVMLIAPASCNTLSKMASGVCDNLLMAAYLSATCPVVVAPAMDEDMWHHPSTQANLEKLRSYGNHVLSVSKGELASGLFGEGRMMEPDMIIHHLKETLFRGSSLKDKKVLITAGPTYEALDPVRFIGNHSSGKMGFALADVFYEHGADVVVVKGPCAANTNYAGIKQIAVTSAQQMYEASNAEFDNSDIAVLAAAVADYSPAKVCNQKIKKSDSNFSLELVKTVDILKSLGERKKAGQLLVGFALETNNEEENAKRKLESKNADLIVLNSLKDTDAGFGKDTNKVTIFDRNSNIHRFNTKSKTAVANDIVQLIIQNFL